MAVTDVVARADRAFVKEEFTEALALYTQVGKRFRGTMLTLCLTLSSALAAVAGAGA